MNLVENSVYYIQVFEGKHHFNLIQSNHFTDEQTYTMNKVFNTYCLSYSHNYYTKLVEYSRFTNINESYLNLRI